MPRFWGLQRRARPLRVLEPVRTTLSSSSLDNESLSSVPEDFRSYQDLLKCMATSLDIQDKFVQENVHKLVNILQPLAPGRVALTTNETILEPAKSFWNSPTLTCTAKCTDKRYYVPIQSFESFFTHPAPNSLADMAASETGKTCLKKESKKLDLVERKFYLTPPCRFIL
ncbi:hypothetical protein KIL84_012022 [Mauremys mutica]|uniref:Uncharacterized protein n=1 Tax=Mauremys mutica TaxID=74926 RepID=A0A9D4B2X7_9SAUR|nr:hypothetical protein KIL84_012022 [Mauremys mutica]